MRSSPLTRKSIFPSQSVSNSANTLSTIRAAFSWLSTELYISSSFSLSSRPLGLSSMKLLTIPKYWKNQEIHRIKGYGWTTETQISSHLCHSTISSVDMEVFSTSSRICASPSTGPALLQHFLLARLAIVLQLLAFFFILSSHVLFFNRYSTLFSTELTRPIIGRSLHIVCSQFSL